MTSDTSTVDPDAYRVALVGCGDDKLDTSAPAKDIYQSTYFAKKREYAEELCDDWAIISAEHHVLDPETEIEPYDATVKTMGDTETFEWAQTTNSQLRSAFDWETVEVVDLLLGQDYLVGVEAALSDLPVVVQYPFDGTSGNGEQMGWCSDRVERGVPAGVDEAATRDWEQQTLPGV